jgi:hypothetical protein
MRAGYEGAVRNDFVRAALLLLSISCAFPAAANNVPAIPNRAFFIGTVKAYCVTSSSLADIQPEQVIYKVVVLVESVKDVEGYPNILKDRAGKTVTLYTKKELSPGLYGKEIRTLVEFRGDERGGLLWFWNIEVIE